MLDTLHESTVKIVLVVTFYFYQLYTFKAKPAKCKSTELKKKK